MLRELSIRFCRPSHLYSMNPFSRVAPLKKSFHLLTLTAVFVALYGCNSTPKPVAAEAAPEKGVAATVNGEAIDLSDFHEHTDLKQTAQVITPQGPTQTHVIGNFGLQSLQELVDQKVLLQLAKEQGVLPTDSDIDNEIKLQTDLRHDYITILQDQGLSQKGIRHEIAIGLARQNLMMKGVDVSSDEVNDFVKKHPERFSDPARATIYFIQASTPQKKSQVDKELAAHKLFTAVASSLSEEPNAKSTGGLYATSIVSMMPPKVQEIVNKTAVKQVSSWIPNAGTFVKFYVESKIPAKPKPASDSQKEMVRRLIGMQKGQVKNNFTKMFYDKLKASKVEVSVPHLQDQWKKTWDQMSDPNNGTPSGR